MRKQLSSAAKVASLLTASMLASAACAAVTGSSGPSAPPAPASTSTPLAAAPSATSVPQPTPLAVLDGEPWIAYEWVHDSDGDGVNENGVYLVRPDGRDQHLLLSAAAGHPDWSPNGERIAVYVEPQGGGFEIRTLDADGTDATVITCDGAPCGSVGYPAWSPDGRQLAFVRGIPPEPDEEYGRSAISVVDLATGATRAVAMPPLAGSEDVQYITPRWSPDGTQIVFTVMRYPVPATDENILGSSIAIVGADGSEADAPRTLTDPAMYGWHPGWSPDGGRIVFSTYPLGSFQDTTKATNLYTIRPDGTELTQVTHFGENDTRATQPTWTPDGRQIIFTHMARNPSNPWGERHIALIDSDGSDLTFLPVPGTAGDYWYGTHARMRPTP